MSKALRSLFALVACVFLASTVAAACGGAAERDETAAKKCGEAAKDKATCAQCCSKAASKGYKFEEDTCACD